MPEITKTQRILSVFHLLQFCDEVSMQELYSLLPGCTKTFSRDIALLKRAGVAVKYSMRRKAFVRTREKRGDPNFPDGKSETRFIKKIIRLIDIMEEMPEDGCDVWYSKTICASRRTMQRDFAVLNSIGYSIKYEREKWNMHDAGIDMPPGRYYCDRPMGAYSLIIFKDVQ